jgi:hypothetical protein
MKKNTEMLSLADLETIAGGWEKCWVIKGQEVCIEIKL